MNFKYLLEDAINTKDPQKWMNNRFMSDTHSIVNNKMFLLKKDKTLWYPNEAVAIEHTFIEYDRSDIHESDIILDIGANVGGFGLSVAPYAKNVLMIEPLFYEELQNNVKLNRFDNVRALNCALSKDKQVQCSYIHRTETSEGFTLAEFIKIAGGHVDFLKCDCEGGEWCIRPEELKGIRRIEIEIHSFNGENKDDFINMLKDCGYNVTTTKNNKWSTVAHCFQK